LVPFLITVHFCYKSIVTIEGLISNENMNHTSIWGQWDVKQI